MKRTEYLKQASTRLAPQQLADAKKLEAIQRKRVAVAGAQLEENESTFEEIGTTSTEEAVQSLAIAGASSVNDTLDIIRWKRQGNPEP
mgnify:CR=1 FL=1